MNSHAGCWVLLETIYAENSEVSYAERSEASYALRKQCKLRDPREQVTPSHHSGFIKFRKLYGQ